MAVILLIVAGMVLVERLEAKRQRKREKKAMIEANYRELEAETQRRLSGTTLHEHKPSLNDLQKPPPLDEYADGTAAPPPAYAEVLRGDEKRTRRRSFGRLSSLGGRRSSTRGRRGEAFA